MSIFGRVVLATGILSLAALTGGCGGSEAGPTGGAGGSRPGDGGSCSDGGGSTRSDASPPTACAVVLESPPIEGANHVAVCSPLTFASNPPSSGNHYPNWAAYQTYERAIPRGFWVHSMEHGAVVITYNCPGGCPSEVAEAQALIDSLPSDCGSTPRRIIMTPDPDLDARFAASSWGFTLRASCFARGAFETFLADHYDHAPESICGGGIDPTDMCGLSACP